MFELFRFGIVLLPNKLYVQLWISEKLIICLTTDCLTMKHTLYKH